MNRNIETKYLVTTFNNLGITSAIPASNYRLFSSANVGGDNLGRLGNEIITTSIKLKFTVDLQQSAEPETMLVRFILYESRRSGEFYDPPGIAEMYNRVDPEAFIVLKEKQFVVSNGNGQHSRTFDMIIPYKRRVHFTTNDGTSIRNHDLYAFFMSNSNVAPDAGLNGYIQVNFKDA